jgi:RNA polymerase sigma-70 factor (ECF subfamily)
MPFHLWARKTAYERLLKARRDHRAARRNVAREAAAPDKSALVLARSLAAPGPTPSAAAEARERADAVARAIEGLPPADREVLLLRHIDGLTHEEVAALLDVTAAAARQRYGRALYRLQKALAGLGLLEDLS